MGFFLQFGYPGETLEDIELTLRMVRDCRPDDIGVSVSYPLPGTPFYEPRESPARREAELDRLERPRDDVSRHLRPEFYRALHALVHAQFQARKLGAAHCSARPPPPSTTACARRGSR